MQIHKINFTFIHPGIQKRVLTIGLGNLFSNDIIENILEFSKEKHPCLEEIQNYPCSGNMNSHLLHYYLYTKISFAYEKKFITMWAHDYIDCLTYSDYDIFDYICQENDLIDSDDFQYRPVIRDMSDLEIYTYIRSLQIREIASKFTYEVEILFPNILGDLLDINEFDTCIGNIIFDLQEHLENSLSLEISDIEHIDLIRYVSYSGEESGNSRNDILKCGGLPEEYKYK